MVDLLPIYVMGGLMGFIIGLIPLALVMIKVPEARFYTMVRLFKDVIVRVHYADEVERCYRAKPDRTGIILADKGGKGKKLCLDARLFSRRKCSTSRGLDILDVGSNTIWPIGQREGVQIAIIEEYVENPENNCPFLKSRELLERHTLLQAKASELPGKIIPMLNIDPASITVDATNKKPEQIEKEMLEAFNKKLETEISKVENEIDRVHAALEGRAVFTQPFSWADACFAANTQLQADNVQKLDNILKDLAHDEDKLDAERWKRIYIGMFVFGLVVVAIIAAAYVLFGQA